MKYLAVALLALGVFALAACASPDPTSTPTAATERIALQWAAGNPAEVAALVVEVIMAAPEVKEKVPALVRVSAPGLLTGIVEDGLGNSLAVSFAEVAYEGEGNASVTLIVSGEIALDLGPFESVDLSVPLIVAVDLDAEQAVEWTADLSAATVSLH